jgi:hypothetical protein
VEGIFSHEKPGEEGSASFNTAVKKRVFGIRVSGLGIRGSEQERRQSARSPTGASRQLAIRKGASVGEGLAGPPV